MDIHPDHRFRWLGFSYPQVVRNYQRIFASYAPEVAAVSEPELRSALIESKKARPSAWVVERVLGAAPALLMACAVYFQPTGLRTILHGVGYSVTVVVVLVAMVVIAVLGPLYVIRGELRRRLREKLRGRGLPICVGCGYELHDDTTICSECGWRVEAGA